MVRSELYKLIAYNVLPASYWRRRWRSAFDRYWSGSAESDVIGSLGDAKAVAIDIGAAEGIMTSLFAKHFREVIAFEPNPEQLRKLRITKPDNARIYNQALGNSQGTADLHVPYSGGRHLNSWGSLQNRAVETSVNTKVYKVPASRLDDFEFKHVALIKIDVEGWEDEVLAGAAETIRQSLPALFIEIEQRHRLSPIEDITNYLLAAGYSAYFLERDQLTPFSEFDVDRHQAIENTQAEYINNFLFIHTSKLDATISRIK